MGAIAAAIFTPASGGSLALEPLAGPKGGAVGIFLPREGVEQFFPVPQVDELYGDSPDSEGGPLVSSRPQNAVGSGTVVISGSDQATFREYHQRWQKLVEAMRREGGTLKYTPAEGTTVTYEIESMRITSAPYDGTKMLGWHQDVAFEFTCRPYGLLASIEQTLRDHDPFARDTISAGEWATFDTGSGTLKVENGQLTPTSTSEKKLHRFGLKTADAKTTIRIITGASVASGLSGLVQKRLDSNNKLHVHLNFTGAASNITIFKVDAGVGTTLATSTNFITAVNTTYWLQMTTVGNVVTGSVYAVDPDVETTTPLKTVSFTLEGANATKFGEGVWGNVGLVFIPAGTDYRWDEWRADAKAFRSTAPLEAFELPSVPGHVDALGDMTITDTATQRRGHVEYGLERAGDFSAVTSPPNLIDSDQFVTATFSGTQTTKTGAFDPLASGNSTVRATLARTPLTVCSTGPQSHTGPYRVKPRVFAAGTGPVYVRAAARYGAGQLVRGDWKLVPAVGEWCELDLGIFTPPVAQAGTQSWEVRFESLSEVTGDTLDIDYAMLIGAGRYAKSRVAAVYESPSGVLLSDTFLQAEGTLSGKALAAALAVTGPSLTTKAENDAAKGEVAWTNPGNVVASDDARASVELGPAQTSQWLKATKFGFAVPEGATINGIVVEIEKSQSSTPKLGIGDARVGIVKAGVVGATDESKFEVAWPTSDGIVKYGSESNLWGETWTPAQINAEGFGVAIMAQNFAAGTAKAFVDAITITVYYTPSGGQTWAESGHEPVYTVDGVADNAKRSGVGDVANTGRFALAGTNEPTTTVVQADVQCSVATGRTGLLARYGSTTQAVALVLTGSPYKVQLLKFSAGPTTTVMQKPEAGFPLTKVAGQSVTLRLEVDATGRWLVWADGLLLGQGYDEALVTGKTLGKGKVGFYDEHNAAAVSRWDNLLVWTPELNASLWSGRRARFRWADAIRESQSGGTWGPVPGHEGGRLRVSPAGPAGLTSRIAVKARRLNVDENVDPNIADELQVSMNLTPRVLLLG